MKLDGRVKIVGYRREDVPTLRYWYVVDIATRKVLGTYDSWAEAVEVVFYRCGYCGHPGLECLRQPCLAGRQR
jgi:hypothetical protein